MAHTEKMFQYRPGPGFTEDCSIEGHIVNVIPVRLGCDGSVVVSRIECQCGGLNYQFFILQEFCHNALHKVQYANAKMSRLKRLQTNYSTSGGKSMTEEAYNKYTKAIERIRVYIDYRVSQMNAISDFIEARINETLGG